MNGLSNVMFDRDHSDNESGTDRSWIHTFCSKPENAYLCKVDEDFISDAFNLYGINSDFHLYKYALSVILNEGYNDIAHQELEVGEIQANAEAIYGMAHARYIVTTPGMDAMFHKYRDGVFGTCPRVYCNHQHLLPIGESDQPRISTVKLFCPCCKEIYHPPPQFEHLDGAYFGTTFPHVFLLNFPSLIVSSTKKFQPTIYGYAIHESSIYYKGPQEKK